METLRKASFGLKGAAFVLLAGLLTVNCSSKSNPAPGGKAGTGGAAGKAGAGGTGGGSGTGGAAGTSAAGNGAAGAPDGGTVDGGDAATACDASGFSQDAGCMACATDPLFGCSSVPTTCVPFNNSVIPANIPRL